MLFRGFVLSKKETVLKLSILAAFSVFAWCWSVKDRGVIFAVLGGIEREGDQIEILQMGRWLFLFAVFFLMMYRVMLDSRRTLLLSMYRYPSFRGWWKHYFLESHLMNLGHYLFCCLLWLLMENVTDNHSVYLFGTIIVFYIHLAMFISILLACGVVWMKAAVPCILLLLEGSAYILSNSLPAGILTCGMYCRIVLDTDYPAVYLFSAVQLVVCMECYFLVPQFWDRGVLFEKNN